MVRWGGRGGEVCDTLLAVFFFRSGVCGIRVLEEGLIGVVVLLVLESIVAGHEGGIGSAFIQFIVVGKHI